MNSVLFPVLESRMWVGRDSQNSPAGNYPEILNLVIQGEPCYFFMFLFLKSCT